MIPELEIVLRLFLATIFGSVVGLEREILHKPAGLRTHMLVCIGSALFTLISIFAFTNSDPARVAAGVVTGIGFLGAGTIFHYKEKIEGLTTAASLWAVAALGMGIGAGLYFLTSIAAVFVILVLFTSHMDFEKRLWVK